MTSANVPLPLLRSSGCAAPAAADDDVEIAVVIDVDERGGAGLAAGAAARGSAGRGRDVCERAAGLLVQQADAAVAQQEQVGRPSLS